MSKESKTMGMKKIAALVAAVAAMLAIAPPASAAPFEIASFDGNVLKENGDPVTQAGSHPYTASTTFFLTTALAPSGILYPSEALKDAIVDLPPGFVGNPRAVETCVEPELQRNGECPASSQVGVVTIWSSNPLGGPPVSEIYPVYNMVTPKGTVALFGVNVASTVFHVAAKVRTGSDYGVTAFSLNSPTTVIVVGVTFTFWGVPADPSFDVDRGLSGGIPCVETSSPSCHNAFLGPEKPFLSLPTSCLGPQRTDLTINTWEGGTDGASFLSHDNTLPIPNAIGNDGCNALDFSPTLEARPTTSAADSPSGLDVDLHVPQNEDPNSNAEADLKEAKVTLPKGLVINPSGANGLDACTSAQIDLHGEGPANCPSASKVGSVEVDTPVLDHALPGNVYVAAPYDNPFDSLLAIYIVVDDPESGVIVKLAGSVELNEETGRLTTTFADNPQLPFEDFKLKIFGGPAATLRTPPVCKTFETTSSMTPWSAPESGPPATPSDSYAIDQGANGADCASSEGAQPHSPSFEGGTVSPISGVYTPLVIHLRREDGSQQFSTVSLTPPSGLLGKLAGIPYCPESALLAAAGKSGKEEKAAPSCPAASEVGSVVAGAGAGPAPYYASGKAYLTGPYKGAPLGLAIVTPAVAGPFDIGTIVVRTALNVDPESTRITAVSDPIPSILKGIPLDVRSIAIKIDRPDFTLNPTSCDPMTIAGQLTSTFGQAASLSNRFQVAECARLKFRPKLDLRVNGKVRRGGHPALRAVVSYPQGAYANIASASVALPHSEFLAQEHIRTICTRVQFAADACPKGSIYGHARAITPLLDQPLEGPVYLRSSSNPLPDLVVDLRGQIHVALVGRIDSFNGGIRTSFESVPDAPVSKFVLEMQGGAKGLLVNSRNICRQTNRATASFDAQNGKTHDLRPVLRAQCGKKSKHKKHARR